MRPVKGMVPGQAGKGPGQSIFGLTRRGPACRLSRVPHMKNSTRRNKRCIVTVPVALALLLLAGAAWSNTYVTVSGGEPAKVLACLPLGSLTTFHLEFINSIYGALVRETLEYEPVHGISLVKVESPSAGVFEYYGLEPDGPGAARLNRPVGEIRLKSHDYEHHRLTVGDKSIRLKGLVPDGEPLLVSVRSFPDVWSCVK